MKGQVFQVTVGDCDEYIFDVEITYFYHQKPMGKWADNDQDSMGYTELDWVVLGGILIDEDGEAIDLKLGAAQDIAEKWEDEIEERLLVEIEEMGEEDYY